jgi:hypothetical protein
VQQASVERRGSWLRLAGVVAVVALLVAVLVIARMGAPTADAKPLNPHDPMSAWKTLSTAQKRATSAVLFEELQIHRRLGPQTSARLADRDAREKLVDDLVSGLDAAVDPNVKAYVSPGQSMFQTSSKLAAEQGWDK